MATVSYEVCDRCKKRIGTKDGYLRSKGKIKKRTFIWWRLSAGASDTWEWDLCDECTKELYDFLNECKPKTEREIR